MMATDTPASLPNILLITADQLRWDCLGCMGNPVIRTPHLDALADEGTRFTNAFSPDPICVPARACIMTGNYPQLCTGAKTNSGSIRACQPLLTEVLKSAGYRTYALGKLHFLPYAAPGEPRTLHGFEEAELTESGRILQQHDPEGRLRGVEDYFDFLADNGYFGYTRAHGVGNNDVRPCPSPLPAELYTDHWIADRTIAALDRHRANCPDRPFFIWMSSPKPHSPYDPPRPYDNAYDPRQVPPPFGSPELLPWIDPYVDATRYSHGVTSLSPQAWQVIRSYYYGNITFLDHQIGRVLARLDTLGLRDDTLVVFASDHGDLVGDFGSCFKACHLNGSVRVPLIAAGPGVRRGAVSVALAGLQDLLPTFAARAGARIGQPVQGIDLSGLLDGATASVREVFYSTTGAPGRQSAMLTDGKFKYTYSEHGGIEELYDQQADIGETRNLAREPGRARLCAQWRERLVAEARRLEDPLVADGELPRAGLDRSAFPSRAATSLGWRWY